MNSSACIVALHLQYCCLLSVVETILCADFYSKCVTKVGMYILYRWNELFCLVHQPSSFWLWTPKFCRR